MKERKNYERNGGGNPPSIKPVYIEFLRRRRPAERSWDLGTFNFIGEEFPSLCFALPLFISNFWSFRDFLGRSSHWPAGTGEGSGACSSVWGGEREAAAVFI